MDKKERAEITKNKRSSHGKLQTFRVKEVLKHSHRKVLDLGCAKGEYVKMLKRKGYEVYGVDVIDFSTEWEANDVHDICQVTNGGFDEFGDVKYDTVLLFEVLEHNKEPEKFLENVRKILSKNLILTVPNCDHVKTLEGSGLNFNHYTDSSHVNFFTMTMLIHLLEKVGFKVIECKMVNEINIIIPFLRSFGVPRNIASKLGRLNKIVPVKEYMTLLVVAEKSGL